MSAIVLARHPVPSSYVAKGCRREWRVFLKHRTPVRFREISTSEAARLELSVDLSLDGLDEGRLAHPCVWYAGRAWAAIGERYDEGLVVPLDRSRFVEWLEAESDVGQDMFSGLAILVGTPLIGEQPGGRWPRGIELDAAEVRREGHCDRDRASRDLVRFFEDRILLVGGVPHVRLPGPIWSLKDTYHGSDPTHLTLMPTRGWLTAATARVAECCKAMGMPVPARTEDAHRLMDLAGRPVGPPDASVASEDFVRFANRAPFSYLQSVGGAVHRWQDPSEGLMEPIRALRRWESLGFVGGVTVEEAGLVATDMMAAIEVMPSVFPKVSASPVVRRLAAYASGYVLPNLMPGRGMDDDDLSALDGLGSGMPPEVGAGPSEASLDGLPLFRDGR